MVSGHRPERIADVVRDVVARLLREEVRDPRIGFVTLTDVRVSPDLRHAKVFFSRLGSDDDRESSRRALNHAVPFFRRALAREAGLRHTPDIRFEVDRSLEQGARVDALIDAVSTESEGDGGSGDPS